VPLLRLDSPADTIVKLLSGGAQQAARAVRCTRIWELSESLHCSIIGTCLSATELRPCCIT
jgi:hypothetical protein